MKHKPYSALELGKKYLHYLFHAGNGKGHGIHSPFVYSLIRDVLNDKGEYYAYSAIEKLRLQLEQNRSYIELLDLGAGGKGHRRERISNITKRTSKSQKLGRLLFRLSNYFQPGIILELGTSMGLSAAYLYAGNTNSRLYTLEGAPAVAEQASANFEQLGYRGISLLTGDFDETLAPLVDKLDQIDLAYIDGNHRYQPTLRYFEELLKKSHPKTVLIFDDIHWSGEMEAAWKQVQQHPDVRCTIDLFFIGLVFFSESFQSPQHFTIRF